MKIKMLKCLLKRTAIILEQDVRQLTTAKLKETSNDNKKYKIQSWQIHSYGDLNELQLTTTRHRIIENPDELLINVEAASVNPIDVLMIGGYGKTLFQIPRNCDMELPLTLGRDFCGTIVNKGHGVSDHSFNIGDKVYGFIPIHKQGSFTETLIADKHHVCRQPQHLTATESASLVYATMTAWSSLNIMGNMLLKNKRGMRVLVLGASGGVGSSAVQLLKAEGCSVFAACATDAVPLVESLGTDCTFDYKDPDYLKNVASEGYYHVILDCAKFGFNNLPETWRFGTYIALNSPLLLNTDKHGLVGGLVTSAKSFLSTNLQSIGKGKSMSWGFFLPSASAFQTIHQLISTNRIRPVIHKEFAFEHLPEAMRTVADGHLRGKVVVKVE